MRTGKTDRVRTSRKSQTPKRVWIPERAAYRHDQYTVVDKEVAMPRTLENMCVIGLVTLMLSKPATQRRNPKTPVTRLPQMKVRMFHSGLAMSAKSVPTSPSRSAKGARKAADPRLVHQASCMVELPQ